jgi:MYXO-CTERM domain-containing protein
VSHDGTWPGWLLAALGVAAIIFGWTR